METMINNLVNGNLSTAKEQAKRFSQTKIRNFLLECQWGFQKATVTAAYLKGEMTFQQYCDTPNS